MVARIVMDRWGSRLVRVMGAAGIEMDMISKYVEDVNTALRAIQKGYAWNKCNSPDGMKWRLEWSEERRDLDTEKNETDAARTIELVREVADSLMPGLKFTTDLPENYPNGKVPMLDLAV